MNLTKKLWVGILLLVFLSPLGVILPAYFKAGAAWGEWSPQEIQQKAGYLPQGLIRLANFWKAPLSGYLIQGWEAKGIFALCMANLLSAIIGVAVIIGLTWLVAKMWVKPHD